LAEATTLSASTFARLFRFFDHLRAALFGRRNDLGSLRLGVAQGIGGTFAGQLQLVLAALAGGKPVSDQFLAISHGLGSGGQTYFMVIQMKTPNQIASPISVALMFTLTSCQELSPKGEAISP
jgi:hypothetical protein